MNQPYGDAILKIRPLAYKVHPYRWAAIGADISHVSSASLQDIKDFFYSHYIPNNAILTLSGNITAGKAIMLAEKWFGPISAGRVKQRDLPPEPEQEEERSVTLEEDVPSDAIYKVWHIGPRKSADFYTLDLMTDILAGGDSGRLHTSLVRDKKLFSEINAYLTSDIDPGLIVLNGKLMNDVDLATADDAINEVITGLMENNYPDQEMDKVRNKFEASTVFAHTNILNKAISLSYFELLGDPDFINREIDAYNSVTREMVATAAKKYFRPSNSCSLYYKSTRKES